MRSTREFDTPLVGRRTGVRTLICTSTEEA
jgi:hypothetical protein